MCGATIVSAMRNVLLLLCALTLTTLCAYTIPRSVEAPSADFEAPAHIAHAAAAGVEPVRIVVPSLGLDLPIIPVGLNQKGQMDVPDGKTLAIGWYSAGTKPGNTGSAVLAAHVYAGFQRLRNIKAGAEIILYAADGSTRTFLAQEKKTYALEHVPADKLFNRNTDAWLNLITCAGAWSTQLGTYDHRLVVYASLVSDGGTGTPQ